MLNTNARCLLLVRSTFSSSLLLRLSLCLCSSHCLPDWIFTLRQLFVPGACCFYRARERRREGGRVAATQSKHTHTYTYTLSTTSTHSCTPTFIYIAAKLMYSNKALSKLAIGKAKFKPTCPARPSAGTLCIWQHTHRHTHAHTQLRSALNWKLLNIEHTHTHSQIYSTFTICLPRSASCGDNST